MYVHPACLQKTLLHQFRARRARIDGIDRIRGECSVCRRAFTIVSTETVDACVDTWREQQQQPPRTIGSDVNVLSMLANTVAALTNTDGSDTQQPLHAHAQMLHTLITSILVPQLQEQVPTDAQRGAVAAGEVISHWGARPEADLQALVAKRLG